MSIKVAIGLFVALVIALVLLGVNWTKKKECEEKLSGGGIETPIDLLSRSEREARLQCELDSLRELMRMDVDVVKPIYIRIREALVADSSLDLNALRDSLWSDPIPWQLGVGE